MTTRGKLVVIGSLCVLAATACVAWILSAPTRPVKMSAEKERDQQAGLHLVEIKDQALAALENRDFNTAEPLLLELATAGTGDPVGARNWLINRIALIGTIDENKNTQAYADAVERARTAFNLEWKLEPQGPVRYLLSSRIEALSQNPDKQIENLHIAAGRGYDDPRIWYELFQVEHDSKIDAVREDADNAIRTLYKMIPENLEVFVEWLKLEARQKDISYAASLGRAQKWLQAFVTDIPKDPSLRPDRAAADALAAVKAKDWAKAARDVEIIVNAAAPQHAVKTDKRHIEGNLRWRIKTDFFEKFYADRGLERVLPKQSAGVHFRDVPLEGPVAGLTDVLAARFVDWDAEGHLAIAVLRKSSFEVYARSKPAGAWTRVAELSVPADAFEHFLTADLDQHAAAPAQDFVLYGPAGVRVVENRPESAGKTRSLRAIESPKLTDGVKDVESVATVDFDGDGDLDLVVARKASEEPSPTGTGVVSVWRNSGGFKFSDLTPRSGLKWNPTDARSMVAVDWDHDFDIDFLVADKTSKVSGIGLLKGTGEGRFRIHPIETLNPIMQRATTIAVVDADANGSPDALISGPGGMALMFTASSQPGELILLRMQTISDFPAQQLLCLDYDNDGARDLVGWNEKEIRCFHGTGNGQFEPAADVLPADLKEVLGVDSGDIDSDGDTDLLVVSPQSGGAGGGRLRLLENDGGNANHWIDVRLVGRAASAGSNGGDPAGNLANPDGVGATLQLKKGAVSQAQVVTGPVTHFGLGTLETADVLRIVWPNGEPQNVLEPGKNHVVRISPPARGWR